MNNQTEHNRLNRPQSDEVGGDKVGGNKITMPKDNESGDVNIGGDVVSGNQTKNTFDGPVGGPVHTGTGNIEINYSKPPKYATEENNKTQTAMLGMIVSVAIVALIAVVGLVALRQREQRSAEPIPTPVFSPIPKVTSSSLSPTPIPTIVPSATSKSTPVPTVPPTVIPTPVCEPGFFVTIEIEPGSVKKNGQATLTVAVENREGIEITRNPEINIIPIRSEFGSVESYGQVGTFTYYAPNYVPEPEPIDRITLLVDDGLCPVKRTFPVSIERP